MKHLCIFLTTLVFACFWAHLLPAQVTEAEKANFDCGFDHYHQTRLAKDAAYAERFDAMSQSIRAKMRQRQNDLAAHKSSPLENCTGVPTVYKIPIVVHVVHHSSTALGVDENVSDADIINVINGINDRLRHTSGLTFPNPHSGSDAMLELCFATRKPDGSATTGIERYADDILCDNNTVTDSTQKTYHWPTTDYCNLYLVRSISSGATGYATLPSQHGLDTDGGVFLGASFWDGLTAHELGHYLSLYHTFQSGCTNNDCLMDNDEVCDTPPKDPSGFAGGTCGAPANNCNTDDDDVSTNNPFRPIAMGGLGDVTDDIENYMDYTGPCWEAFTEDQAARMRVALETSRASLLASNGCTPFTPDDAGISAGVFPSDVICAGSFTPRVMLRNYGTATLMSATINAELDGAPAVTTMWTGSLAPDSSIEVSLTAMSTTPGSHNLYIYTNLPNGNPDGYATNDPVCVSFDYNAALSTFPASYDMEAGSVPVEWSAVDQDGLVTFDISSTPTNCASNGSFSVAYYSFEVWTSSSGTQDYLVSNPLDFNVLGDAELSFDLAYKSTWTNRTTVLDVEISTDCGETWTSEYSKTTTALNTSTSGWDPDTNWIPTACTEWRNEVVNLDAYIGNEVLIRFKADIPEWWGQNLFLDNINLSGSVITGQDEMARILEQVSIFPVPTEDVLHLKSNVSLTPARYKITDLMGKTIQEGILKQPEIATADLISGTYFLSLRLADQSKVFKFIRQ